MVDWYCEVKMSSSYVVECASCGTGNRIPAQKEGIAGRCGKCRAKLLPLYFQPQPLADGNFDAFVMGYPGPVLVEFWAPW